MKNLYSFSKDAWHAKLYKWLYGVDPTQKYKNMCPYFWMLVITFLIIPFVVLAKWCGNLSVIIYHKINNEKNKKWEKRKEKFLEYCKKDLTPKEAYKLFGSEDWVVFNYFLSNDVWDKIYDLKNKYKFIPKKKLINVDINWDLTMIGVLTTFLLILGGCIFWQIEWARIDWSLLGSVLFFIIKTIIFVVGIYNIWNYFFHIPRVSNFLNNVWKFIKNVASKVWHGVLIVGDMAYNFYKKQCPRIEWK